MLRTIQPYKQFNKLVKNETFEPMLSWGLRMAISAMVPLLWGLIVNRISDAVWITLTAEAICWVELKGSYAWRMRTLTGGAILAVIFSIFGSLVGDHLWWSVIGMLGVGFLATVLKNIGDRASGLAICVYLLFIFSNAYPTASLREVEHRSVMVLIGAGWAIITGMAISLFTPKEEPFRRQIALIWRAVGDLIATVSKGWDGNDKRSNIRDVYLQEKAVRAAIDTSLQFYESMAHQVAEKDKQHYELAQLRKITSTVAVHIIAASDEIETLEIKELDYALRIRLATLFKAMNDTVSRMAIYTITLRNEETLLITSRINRLKKLTGLVKQSVQPENAEHAKALARVVQLTERTIRLLENAMHRMAQLGEDLPVFRSYSLVKTAFILNPKYLVGYLRLLFSFSTLTTRYALRSAIAAAIAMFIYKYFHVDHGYWLAFSVMIVIQPYFGATLKRAMERVGGTILGGLVGSLLVRLSPSVYVSAIMLFVTFIAMVYYLRRSYSVAVFAITVNLVLLFHIEAPTPFSLIIMRAICTAGGAGLALLLGFILPTWDKKWLPIHLAAAIDANYQYFINTFFAGKINQQWTRNKRVAEINNSNVFDSFNRYMQEPTRRTNSTLYYDIITHNIRITRSINNINLEVDTAHNTEPDPEHQALINECLLWFNKIIAQVGSIHSGTMPIHYAPRENYVAPFALTENQKYDTRKLLIELKSMLQDIEQLTGKQHVE